MTTTKQAVLLLAHGSPDTLDDLPAFLSSVRGGRPVSEEAVAAYRRRYLQIGGGSPLSEITHRTVKALRRRLGQAVYLGTRHGRPTISAAVETMVEDGVKAVTALCLTPYYSRLTVGGYRRQLDKAIEAQGAFLRVTFVQNWHLEPAYLSGLHRALEQGLTRFPSGVRSEVAVVFSAHSLPQRALAHGDPYAQQIQETAQSVAELVGLDSGTWSLAYQSAPPSSEPWLGPDLDTALARLAEDGVRNVLLAPIGFVADNIEILYDLDIECGAFAQTLDLHLERTPLLNDDPALITALAHAVHKTDF